MNSVQVQLADFEPADFGLRPLLARHNLQDLDLFSEAAIIELLNRFPREHLYAWATGRDHERPEHNRLAAQNDVDGATLLRAIKNGRFWVNITRIDRVDSEYRKLIERIYEQLAAQVPGFEPLSCQGALLISSPQSITYYHADAPANMLWHIRGRKRIWIYPALDERYLKREFLEEIFAGVRHEYLPFDESFDSAAVRYDIEPGHWAAWPHNAPHRVSNLDGLNVSLATEHFTHATVRRERLYAANRFLRSRFHLRNLSAREEGAMAAVKIGLHRVGRRLGLEPLQYKRYVPVLKVDADAPEGVAPLPVGGS
jgi:hypothetical protein